MPSNIYIHIPRVVGSSATNINLVSNQEVEDNILFLKNSVIGLNHKDISDELKNRKQIEFLNTKIECVSQSFAEQLNVDISSIKYNLMHQFKDQKDHFEKNCSSLDLKFEERFGISNQKLEEYQVKTAAENANLNDYIESIDADQGTFEVAYLEESNKNALYFKCLTIFCVIQTILMFVLFFRK